MFEAEQTNQRQGRAQDFQGNMAQYEAGVGEQSDYRRQQIAQENALHQANIQQAHELVTNDLAKGRFGYEQEIVNRYKQGALNEENMFKAKQLILQKNVEGLGKGTHRFGSEQDQVLLDKTLPLTWTKARRGKPASRLRILPNGSTCEPGRLPKRNKPHRANHGERQPSRHFRRTNKTSRGDGTPRSRTSFCPEGGSRNLSAP
jgi:hypothetical protein